MSSIYAVIHLLILYNPPFSCLVSILNQTFIFFTVAWRSKRWNIGVYEKCFCAYFTSFITLIVSVQTELLLTEGPSCIISFHLPSSNLSFQQPHNLPAQKTTDPSPSSSSSPLCTHSLHVCLCNTGTSLTFHHSELFQDGSETHLHAACPVWKGQGSVPRQTRGSTEITRTENLHLSFACWLRS